MRRRLSRSLAGQSVQLKDQKWRHTLGDRLDIWGDINQNDVVSHELIKINMILSHYEHELGSSHNRGEMEIVAKSH